MKYCLKCHLQELALWRKGGQCRQSFILSGPSAMMQHWTGVWSTCRSCLWKGHPILVIWAITGFSYKKTTLFLTSSVKQKGWSHENNLLHFQIKARTRRCCNRRHWVGAACSLLWYGNLAKFTLQPGDKRSTTHGQNGAAQAWAYSH